MVSKTGKPVSFHVILPYRTSRINEEHTPALGGGENFENKTKEETIGQEKWEGED